MILVVTFVTLTTHLPKGMTLYKTTIKLKREFKITKYTESKPDRKAELMKAWYSYCDGFELSEEEFETFKDSISIKTKKIQVQPWHN